MAWFSEMLRKFQLILGTLYLWKVRPKSVIFLAAVLYKETIALTSQIYLGHLIRALGIDAAHAMTAIPPELVLGHTRAWDVPVWPVPAGHPTVLVWGTWGGAATASGWGTFGHQHVKKSETWNCPAQEGLISDEPQWSVQTELRTPTSGCWLS